MLLCIMAQVDLAGAADCGDTSGPPDPTFPSGTKIPCNCGDTVTSNTNLNSSHPVTTTVCPDEGLTVLGTGTSAFRTLQFNGNTIRGSGTGTGTGVIISGDRVRLFSGIITDFQDGVGAIGNTNNSIISGINASGNSDAGIDIAGHSNTISTSQAFSNGGNGITVVGNTNTIMTSEASSNDGDGLNIVGNGNTVSANKALSDGGNGIDATGDNNRIEGNSVGELGEGNDENGIRVTGSDDPVLPVGQVFNNRISDNDVFGNGADGIVVLGGKT